MESAKGIVRKGSGFFRRDKGEHHHDGGEQQQQQQHTAVPANPISAVRPLHARRDSASSVKAAMQLNQHLMSSSSSEAVPLPSYASTPGGRKRSDSFAPSPLSAKPATAMSPEDSLKSYELFEALRMHDPIHSTNEQTAALVAAVQAAPRSGPGVPTPLHTAVRCAKLRTLETVLPACVGDINAVDADGQTPLHVAAALGRADIVKLLLSQPDINDAIRDHNGRTALEVAKGAQVAQVLQVARAQYNETYISLLAAYAGASGQSSQRQSLTGYATPIATASEPIAVDALTTSLANTDTREALYRFISRERSSGIDYSALTSGSRGTTVIHEAARRRDVDMLKLCVARGASLVVRDRKGKMPTEYAKDDAVRAILRQGATSESRALRQSTSSLASLSLNPSAGAGSASAPIMKGYLSKWTNMARGYKTRWFVLHHGHLSYYRDQEEEGQASRGVISMAIATVEISTDKAAFIVGTTLGKTPRWFLKGAHPVEVMQWINALRTSIEFVKMADQGNASLTIPSSPSIGGSSPNMSSSASLQPPQGAMASSASSIGRSSNASDISLPSNRDGKPVFPGIKRTITSGTANTANTDLDGTRPTTPEMTDEEDASASGSHAHPPHEDTFVFTSNSTKTQIQLTEQLISSLTSPEADRDPARRKQVVTAAQQSLRSLAQYFDTHLEQITDRERYFSKRWEREIQAKRMWEDNMKNVISSQADLERELQDTARQNERRKRVLKDIKAGMDADMAAAEAGMAPAAAAVMSEQSPATPSAALIGGALSPSRLRSPTAVSHGVIAQMEQLAAESDSDDDDDFYDAVESGTLPIKVDEQIASPGSKEWPEDFRPNIPEDALASFQGYRNLRDRLPITSDERPPVSLWAILKGSIGKDLTKISFPVYFNEPTSMLQRMAEDMEYSECLDAASAEQDSLKRIAYVAGFAMSNYASTIGRIAKPFNPMLSETFEMASLDKHYRYVSEQVSHHPPMSACIAESPDWLYYGEVDAKSKFLGKSFEIRPTGIAHAELLLPEAWVSGQGYPASRGRPGYVREHYSWKKVTTSISNFIMGSPQIDHYGDMEITNHRTGERCVLTFKPRGWRGKDSCEIKGTVFDAKGTIRWDLAGRWNGQLVARRAGAGSGALMPDDAVPTVKGSASAIAPEYLLIWKINVQPPNMPFNLTRYALTLNDSNPDIKKYLPPTDCRLRPDQHAFESGQFEQANNLKGALETFQRATRTKRETGELPPHKPRWFSQQMDPDTGVPYWEPSRSDDGKVEYWDVRLANYHRLQKGGNPEWPNVDEIFGVKF